LTGKVAFVAGAVLMVANWPWTMLRILPTNNVLMATAVDDAGPQTRALLVKWNRLHAIRTALRSFAVVGFLTALTAN